MKNTDTGTVIAVCALMTVLFGIIQLSVWPIKKDIAKLETGQVKLEKRMDNIEVKLDTLLALIKKK